MFLTALINIWNLVAFNANRQWSSITVIVVTDFDLYSVVELNVVKLRGSKVSGGGSDHGRVKQRDGGK